MAATYQLTIGGQAHTVEIVDRDGSSSLTIDGQPVDVDLRAVDGPLLTLLIDGESFEVVAVEQRDGYEIAVGDQLIEVEIERPGRSRRLEGIAVAAGVSEIQAPLTGVVISVSVTAGEPVSAGQVLVVIESMKMNNEIRAPRDAAVTTVHVQPGQRVERSTLLVTLQ